MLEQYYIIFLCFVFQVLIIFSDGLDEPVEKLEREADLLKSSGRILGDTGHVVAIPQKPQYQTFKTS